MYMRKQLIIASFIVISLTNLNAQCKYASNFSDLVNCNWIEIDNVSFENRSATDNMRTGGADLNLITNDDNTDKQIKQNARFIICGDSLFVNCKSLKYQNNILGNGFARAYRLENGDVCFVANKVEQTTPKRTTGSGFTFRVGDGEVSSLDNNEKQACYIISNDDTKVSCINRKYMKELLKNNIELSNEYNTLNKKKQESPNVIISYITKMQQ